ncbi:hypothetical protein [Altererythrobacter sp. ZODW24]|uniref:hypothetical protein n=1 Tax=Altererythrobacter sp. ZODW24 TaxID=2185142 RepID=UPI0013B450F7|nr:hypothetical protein [Altererythrobacter sp. ZODW24]
MSNSISPRTCFALGMAGAACLAVSTPTMAQGTSLPSAISVEPVPDAELAEMHGKFVAQDDVSFFGISLITSWQDNTGVTTSARLVFSVDFLGGGNGSEPVPALMIGWEREGDPAMDVTDTHSGYVPVINPGQVLPVGGIGTHQGAAQANIIAGAGNAARNGMQIAIVPAAAMPQMSVAGLQLADSTSDFAFADGDQLQFLLEDNQIGIVMTGGNGLDSSVQSLGGDVGQILQQSLLNTDGNSILNSASIILAADNFGGPEGVSVESAMSAMKGNGY